MIIKGFVDESDVVDISVGHDWALLCVNKEMMDNRIPVVIIIDERMDNRRKVNVFD